MAHGCALPVFTLFFGDLADGFILQAISSSVAESLSDQILNGSAAIVFPNQTIGSGINVDLDCSSTFLINTTFMDNSTISGSGAIPFMGDFGTPLTITDFLPIISMNNSRLIGARCLLGGTFIAEINIYTYAFIGIALGVWLVSMIQVATFQFTSERQVHRIRLLYYRAIMRQDIAWFDENPTGALVNRLSE